MGSARSIKFVDISPSKRHKSDSISPAMFPTMINTIFSLALLQFVRETTATQSIQDITEVFRSAQIVPDVIPAFNPSLLLDVSFGGRIVVPGEILTKNGTKFLMRSFNFFQALL